MCIIGRYSRKIIIPNLYLIKLTNSLSPRLDENDFFCAFPAQTLDFSNSPEKSDHLIVGVTSELSIFSQYGKVPKRNNGLESHCTHFVSKLQIVISNLYFI